LTEEIQRVKPEDILVGGKAWNGVAGSGRRLWSGTNAGINRAKRNLRTYRFDVDAQQYSRYDETPSENPQNEALSDAMNDRNFHTFFPFIVSQLRVVAEIFCKAIKWRCRLLLTKPEFRARIVSWI
jgi:hypothetical protein